VPRGEAALSSGDPLAAQEPLPCKPMKKISAVTIRDDYPSRRAKRAKAKANLRIRQTSATSPGQLT